MALGPEEADQTTWQLSTDFEADHKYILGCALEIWKTVCELDTYQKRRIVRSIISCCERSQELYKWGVKKYGATRDVKELVFPSQISVVLGSKVGFRSELSAFDGDVEKGEKGLMEPDEDEEDMDTSSP